MRIRDHREGFGLITIVLHWSVALTTLGLFALGLWMTELDYYNRWYNAAPALHKSLGMLLCPVVLFAIGWRLGVTRPPLPESVPSWQRRASRTVHLLLVVILLSTLFSGYLIPTANGHGVDVFGWFTVPALPTLVAQQEDRAGVVHLYAGWLLIGLAALHALAALKHQFVDRDGTLRRMLDPR